jgi:nucleotide-binding universal stress UspA family protein
MFERILVPLDGSSLAETAIGLATEVALKFDSEVILLQVVPEGSGERDLAERYLASMDDILRKGHVNCRDIVAESNEAPSEIVNAAIREGASLIIMSTHGKSGRRTMEAGSVATVVLSKSHVAVLFAKPTEYRGFAGSG